MPTLTAVVEALGLCSWRSVAEFVLRDIYSVEGFRCLRSYSSVCVPMCECDMAETYISMVWRRDSLIFLSQMAKLFT